MNTTQSYLHCVNTLVFNMQVWSVKSQDSMQSSKIATKLNELALGCDQAWLRSRQPRTHGTEFSKYPRPETSAQTGHRLSLIADCSDLTDCKHKQSIGINCQFCRLIGQALITSGSFIFFVSHYATCHLFFSTMKSIVSYHHAKQISVPNYTRNLCRYGIT